MKYSKEQCIAETQEHINEVRKNLDKMSAALLRRGKVHDRSKLRSPELEIFTEYTPNLKTSTYGSEEYKENLKGMQVALDHHYKHNSHHPEYYDEGIKGMDLLDIVEMFCDWKAATVRHADGDIHKSIEINKQRFAYSDELEQIFKNSVKIFD